MCEEIVAHNVAACAMGLGPKLLYNSPVKACAVMCRMNKSRERKNKALFINAVNEVTREPTQSFLANEHIQWIVVTYQAVGNEDGFARVVGSG